ncbi:cytochrome B [Rhodobaculum claviforme]
MLLLAGCGGPLSSLDPAGPAAGATAVLWWAMLIGAGVLTLMVLGLLAAGFGRPRPVREGRWTVGLGLWFSIAVLSALLAAGVWVGERLLPRGDAVVTVEAHARQWGWRFGHPDGRGGRIETDGTLHIPAGQPVDVIVTSADVIHSFWVPRLAGKIDAIPGRANRLRIEADTPGSFDGLCAEFCGLGHAGMRFRVIAHPPDDWPAVLETLGEETAE